VAATLADVPSTALPRPASLLVAVGGAGVMGTALIALAIASLASGHGTFSGGVGLVLLAYGAVMLAAGWALWRGSVLGRGPVVALSLLNGIAAYTFTASAPWVWVGVVVSAITVVAAGLPATSRALRLQRGGEDVRPAGGPPPTDDPGR
jgi:hypothetical protein